jgi:uncharacterized HAD superfamily protein
LSSNRTIYVDYDDVLSETARAFLDLLAEHFDKWVSFEAITSFDLGISFDLNASEYERFMALAHEPQVLAGFMPIAGAISALERLIAKGYEIAIITGRPASSAPASQAWLEQHSVPYHTLTFVDKYGRGDPQAPNSKAITLKELRQLSFCFAVEDSGDMARFIAEEMGLPVALLERPWNKGYRFSSPESQALIKRCADWDQVVGAFGMDSR